MSKARDKEGFHSPFAALKGVKIDVVAGSAPAAAAAKGPAKEPKGLAAKLAARAAEKANAQAASAARAATPKSEADDSALFLQEMAGTAPIVARKDRVGGPAASPGPRKAPVSEDAEVMAQLADLCDGHGTFDIADSDEYVEGLADGVDRRILKRLRAGEFAVQAHVDLHGLTKDEAKEKVARFVAESRKAGQRCVLLVHGRGLHSKDNIPVLKSAVRSWLERGTLARAVLAFATARPHDGGAGAMYVLLRRT